MSTVCHLPNQTLYSAIRNLLAPRTSPNLLPIVEPVRYIEILLKGIENEPNLSNSIFHNFQTYIIETGRFSRNK